MADTWSAEAYAVLEAIPQGSELTSDDLLEVVGHPDLSHAPNAGNNAVGSVFRKAAFNGLIRSIGITRSKQPHRKGGIVRVWQRV